MSALPWPKLSETLRFERHPHSCQNCGRGPATGTPLVRHIECDAKDQPTRTVVVLCDSCTARLVERHPRLYLKQDANTPLLGAMELCVDCKHRKALNCTHPSAKENGGTGLELRIGQPVRGFTDGRDPKTGKRTGGLFVHYPAPASACAGQIL